MNRLFELVQEAVRESGGLEVKDASALLKEDLGLDSLSLVSVVVRLEESLGVLFDEEELDPAALLTAADLVTLAEKTVS